MPGVGFVCVYVTERGEMKEESGRVGGGRGEAGGFVFVCLFVCFCLCFVCLSFFFVQIASELQYVAAEKNASPIGLHPLKR